MIAKESCLSLVTTTLQQKHHAPDNKQQPDKTDLEERRVKMTKEIEIMRKKRAKNNQDATLMSSSVMHTTEMRKGQESKALVEDIINEKRLNRIPRYAESNGTWSPAIPKNPTKKDFLSLMKTINARFNESP